MYVCYSGQDTLSVFSGYVHMRYIKNKRFVKTLNEFNITVIFVLYQIL